MKLLKKIIEFYDETPKLIDKYKYHFNLSNDFENLLIPNLEMMIDNMSASGIPDLEKIKSYTYATTFLKILKNIKAKKKLFNFEKNLTLEEYISKYCSGYFFGSKNKQKIEKSLQEAFNSHNLNNYFPYWLKLGSSSAFFYIDLQLFLCKILNNVEKTVCKENEAGFKAEALLADFKNLMKTKALELPPNYSECYFRELSNILIDLNNKFCNSFFKIKISLSTENASFQDEWKSSFDFEKENHKPWFNC